MESIQNKYLRCLEPWIKAQGQYFYASPERPELACYGTGYNGWGVQTNQKACATLAVLATDPNFNENSAELSQEKVLELALQTLRFSLESHIEGDYHCTDGTKWGHTWISALGLERMMHGVDAIENQLTKKDKALLRQVLISESDWLLDHLEIVAGLVAEEGKNKPESNLWNGAVLLRTATMYPDAPRALEYQEKGIRFLINSISIPQDETAQEFVDGKSISERFVDANFFDSFALNHHGYLNIGYMVICLSNAAMLYFFYKKKGLKPPKALFHHLEDLWKIVKKFTFPDGRLLRIGGDTRVRYCYCQDYAIPAWLLMEDLKKDSEALAFELGWLAQLEKELAANGDGSFLSERLRKMRHVSPLYYTRLEADRAVTLSMAAYWRRIFALPQSAPKSNLKTVAWSDEFHGAAMVRGNNRIASFVWGAAQSPQGLCLPIEKSDLAEWRNNLAGEIKGLGSLNYQEVVFHQERQFPGGFLTWGKTNFLSERMSAEQQPDEILAEQRLVFVALPDEATVVVLQRAVNPARRTYLSSVKGLFLQIPNDLFNDNKRTYFTQEGKVELAGFGSEEKIEELKSSWLNIEDKLAVIGLYGAPSLSIYRPGRRQLGLKSYPHSKVDLSNLGGQLYADEICYPLNLDLHTLDPKTLIYDLGVLLQVGVSHEKSREYLENKKWAQFSQSPQVKALQIEGVDGNQYLIMENSGGEPVALEKTGLPFKRGIDLAAGVEVQFEGLKLSGDTVELFQL